MYKLLNLLLVVCFNTDSYSMNINKEKKIINQESN